MEHSPFTGTRLSALGLEPNNESGFDEPVRPDDISGQH